MTKTFQTMLEMVKRVSISGFSKWKYVYSGHFTVVWCIGLEKSNKKVI